MTVNSEQGGGWKFFTHVDEVTRWIVIIPDMKRYELDGEIRYGYVMFERWEEAHFAAFAINDTIDHW